MKPYDPSMNAALDKLCRAILPEDVPVGNTDVMEVEIAALLAGDLDPVAAQNVKARLQKDPMVAHEIERQLQQIDAALEPDAFASMQRKFDKLFAETVQASQVMSTEAPSVNENADSSGGHAPSRVIVPRRWTTDDCEAPTSALVSIPLCLPAAAKTTTPRSWQQEISGGVSLSCAEDSASEITITAASTDLSLVGTTMVISFHRGGFERKIKLELNQQERKAVGYARVSKEERRQFPINARFSISYSS